MTEQAQISDAKIAKDPEVTAMLKRMEENLSIGGELSKQLTARLTPVLNATAVVAEGRTESRKQSTVPMAQLLTKYDDSIMAINGAMADLLNRIEI